MLLYSLLVVDVPLDIVETPVVPVPDVLHHHLILELPPDECWHELSFFAPSLPAQMVLVSLETTDQGSIVRMRPGLDLRQVQKQQQQHGQTQQSSAEEWESSSSSIISWPRIIWSQVKYKDIFPLNSTWFNLEYYGLEYTFEIIYWMEQLHSR